MRHAKTIFALFLIFVFAIGYTRLSHAQTNEQGRFFLYKYQKMMGEETYEIRDVGEQIELNSKFRLKFIGSKVALDTSLKLDGKSLLPVGFVSNGMSSTRTHVDINIRVADRIAQIENGGEVKTVRTPNKFFTVFHPAPVSSQMMLFRYWKTNKIRGSVPLLPGGEAKIRFIGFDDVAVDGRKHSLERYSIEGVMWGKETVWFDKDQNLIALVGADAEMDRFEAVREGFEGSLSFFVKKSAEDAVKHLKDLSARIKPINEGSYAISGPNLIGGKDFEIITDSVLIIENGKITAAGKRGEVKIPKDMKVYDAKGKSILPGLFDLHAHATQAEWFPASLAAGITTMRDAANELEFIKPIRDAVKSGEITVSPRLLLAGYIDSGVNAVGSVTAETPEEARAIVRRYKHSGFEQIKIYQSLKPELIKVVADEAHKLGMTVTGHIPTGVDIYRAVDDGYDQINHLGFVFPVMTPRDVDTSAGGKRNFDPENEASKAGFRFLKENGIVIEPTLSRGEMTSKILGDSYVSVEPGAAKLPFEFSALVKSMGISREAAERRSRGSSFALTFLKALHDFGIPLVVGTDLVVPGHTEFREIELFVKAGISPVDAIKAATIVPANAMKVDDRLGTLEPGKLADLIIVDGDPLEQISLIRKVTHVIKEGKMFETSPLWKSVNFTP